MSAPLNSDIQQLKVRYRRELRDYDARPAQYKPRWQITDAGAALLLHRAVEAANANRGGTEPVIADDEGGEA
jgi:hypothetical protein